MRDFAQSSVEEQAHNITGFTVYLIKLMRPWGAQETSFKSMQMKGFASGCMMHQIKKRYKRTC